MNSALSMSNSPLLIASSPKWLMCVLENFNSFLLDHAAAEKKAASMAVSMLSHYPDRPKIVRIMSELAVEEMIHFREVIKLIQSRQLQLQADQKDPYVNKLRSLMRQGSDVYLLDRLLTGAVIEARGAERFALVAEGLTKGRTKDFYELLARAEMKHYQLFLNLAAEYFPSWEVELRWQELLVAEATCIKQLPVKARLH